jgi:hypothetical protein
MIYREPIKSEKNKEQGEINKGKLLKGLVLCIIEPCSFLLITNSKEGG